MRRKKHKVKIFVALSVTTFFIYFLAYFLSDTLRACYSLKLTNGKEELYSPEIYINGSVWVENNKLIYRPFRAAFSITLKDSVSSFNRTKCDRSP